MIALACANLAVNFASEVCALSLILCAGLTLPLCVDFRLGRSTQVSSCTVRVMSISTTVSLTHPLIRPEADLHAILSTRMLLHLRSWANRVHHHGSTEANGSWTVDGLDCSTADHDFAMTRGTPSPMRFADSEAVQDNTRRRRPATEKLAMVGLR